MKKIIVVALALIIYGNMSFAQCSKDLLLTSAKTEYLDGLDSVQHTEIETTQIEINKIEISITPANDEARRMTGKIKSIDCNWSQPFKEGRSLIKAVFVNRAGETQNAQITIVGKGGKVVFLLEVGEPKNIRVRVVADKFEEKK